MLGWAGETAALHREKPRLLLESERATHATQRSVAKTPYFLEGSLSGGDNGRDRRFKAQSGLRWLGEKPDQPSESRG